MKSSRAAHLLPTLTVIVLVGAAGCSVTPADPASGSAESTVSSDLAVTTTPRTGADSESTSGAAGDDDTVCAELQIVQDLSDDVSESVDDILSAAATQGADGQDETLQSFVALGDQLEASLPELTAAYDRAAAAASDEVAEEIRAVADGTALLTPALAQGFRDAAEAGEMIDFEEALGDPELQAAAQRAGLASLRLDNFTNPVCGFRFSNS